MNDDWIDYKYPGWYAVKKRHAIKVLDHGDYSRLKGEVNPQLSRVFLSRYMHDGAVVWEPFAGVGTTKVIEEYPNMEFIAYDLDPKDDRIQKKNSINAGPDNKINGMIFHPPYFGSDPFSDNPTDLARETNPRHYLGKLYMTISHCVNSMSSGGYACVVGRNYRHDGKNIPLDWWFVKTFLLAGFDVEIEDIYSSIPDIAVIMRLK